MLALTFHRLLLEREGRHIRHLDETKIAKLLFELPAVESVMMHNVGDFGGMENAGLRVEIGKTESAARQQHFMEGSQDSVRIGHVVHGHTDDDHVITSTRR